MLEAGVYEVENQKSSDEMRDLESWASLEEAGAQDQDAFYAISENAQILAGINEFSNDGLDELGSSQTEAAEIQAARASIKNENPVIINIALEDASEKLNRQDPAAKEQTLFINPQKTLSESNLNDEQIVQEEKQLPNQVVEEKEEQKVVTFVKPAQPEAKKEEVVLPPVITQAPQVQEELQVKPIVHKPENPTPSPVINVVEMEENSVQEQPQPIIEVRKIKAAPRIALPKTIIRLETEEPPQEAGNPTEIVISKKEEVKEKAAASQPVVETEESDDKPEASVPVKPHSQAVPYINRASQPEITFVTSSANTQSPSAGEPIVVSSTESNSPAPATNEQPPAQVRKVQATTAESAGVSVQQISVEGETIVETSVVQKYRTIRSNPVFIEKVVNKVVTRDEQTQKAKSMPDKASRKRAGRSKNAARKVFNPLAFLKLGRLAVLYSKTPSEFRFKPA